MTNALRSAIELATKAHEGQFRRDGKTPYITHPLAVMDMMDTDIEKIAAVLHDVIEDTDYELHKSMNKKYFQILSPNGELTDIPEDAYWAIYSLTKPSSDISKIKESGVYMSYEGYIHRVSIHPIARKVKIADMFHNISDNPTTKQKDKYFKALAVLLKVL